jgi:hypothetical protein
MAPAKKESTSFLKKRSKRLLLIAAPHRSKSFLVLFFKKERLS